MNKTLLGIGVILAGIGLFIGGFFFGQMNSQSAQAGWMMGSSEGLFGPGMMYNGQVGSGMMDTGQNGAGMMGNGMMNGGNNGMMGSMMNGQSGPSMMGGNMMDGQFGSGMMGSFGSSTNVDPLSLEDAETAVTNYLATLDNDNLAIGEIMIFDNHAYAQIIDKTTETGAFEVLIDPATQNVFPEPGPNMMWNTEYGMMSGGMMEWGNLQLPTVS